MTSAAIRPALATALLLGTAVLAAACGSVGPQASGGQPTGSASPRTVSSSSPAASPPAPATPAATVAGCASSALQVVVDLSQAGAAAGSTYYPIDFTNTGSSTCTLYGFPGVSFVSGRGGSQIGRPANRNPAGGPVTVTLRPGAVAHATLQVAEAGNYSAAACKPVAVHWLKIYPPNQFAPLYTHFTTQACSARLAGGASQLGIYPMRMGAGKRGQAP